MSRIEIFTKLLLEGNLNTIIKNSRRAQDMIIDFLEMHEDELKNSNLNEIIKVLRRRDFYIEVSNNKHNLNFGKLESE